MNTILVNGVPTHASNDEFDDFKSMQLEMRRQTSIQSIKSERDRRADSGGYMVNGKWFHSDQKSRSQQLGLVMLGNAIPKNLQWRTMDGSFVEMNKTLAQQVLAAAATNDQEIFFAAEKHISKVLEDDSSIEHDWSSGWPQTFGEWLESQAIQP